MSKVKAVFALEMEDEVYQYILERVELRGAIVIPFQTGITVTKPEARA